MSLFPDILRILKAELCVDKGREAGHAIECASFVDAIIGAPSTYRLEKCTKVKYYLNGT